MQPQDKKHAFKPSMYATLAPNRRNFSVFAKLARMLAIASTTASSTSEWALVTVIVEPYLAVVRSVKLVTMKLRD